MTTSTDEKFAKELNGLSLEKREEILDEIHCVQCSTVEEDPDFIQTKMFQLQDEIDALPWDDRKAYDDSLAMESQYFLQQDVQLKFLRAEKFNAKRAAIRLAKNAEMTRRQDENLTRRGGTTANKDRHLTVIPAPFWEQTRG